MLFGIAEGVVAMDTNNRITLVNKVARELLDLPERAVGMALGDLADRAATARRAARRRGRGERRRGERRRNADGATGRGAVTARAGRAEGGTGPDGIRIGCRATRSCCAAGGSSS